jgi:DnaD/phage-associated family protein
MAGTRPVIPPEFIRGRTRIFSACKDHPVLFYTYTALEALSWGADSRTVEFDGDWFHEQFGIPQGTLLRHLALLAKQPIQAILVYRSAGAGNRRIQVVLADGEQADASLKNETVAEMRIALVLNNNDQEIESEIYKNKNSLKNETVSKMIPGERPNIFALYEANIGPLTPILADKLREAERTYEAAWVNAAFGVAVKRNKRRWDYVEGVLKNWLRDGFKPESATEDDKKTSTAKNAALIQRMVSNA